VPADDVVGCAGALVDCADAVVGGAGVGSACTPFGTVVMSGTDDSGVASRMIVRVYP